MNIEQKIKLKIILCWTVLIAWPITVAFYNDLYGRLDGYLSHIISLLIGGVAYGSIVRYRARLRALRSNEMESSNHARPYIFDADDGRNSMKIKQKAKRKIILCWTVSIVCPIYFAVLHYLYGGPDDYLSYIILFLVGVAACGSIVRNRARLRALRSNEMESSNG